MSKKNQKTKRAEILRKRSENRANFRVRSFEHTIDLTNASNETKLALTRLIAPINYIVKSSSKNIKVNSKPLIRFELASRIIPVANQIGMEVKNFIPKPKVKRQTEPEKPKEVQK